ncbi:MAG: peptidyl-prolyl cis-trans isomerase [Gammaproteobacteria bacterium]|nr:peptidyl-prolyl cis-trans isomerase [Gammaproteobacteria bacterium]
MRPCRCRPRAWLALALAMLGGTVLAAPPRVRIETSAGNIVVQLEPERAPLSVKNFLQYATDGFYTGTIFHRVVTGFIIQGGGYQEDLTLKPARPSIANESGNGLSNHRGTIAMARSADPHSADAQFYFNLADNVTLDPKPTRWGYAVFGEVTEGMEVVDDIGHRATGVRNDLADVPVKPVVIRKVVVLPDPEP